jgi:MoaA/NifB/PqqE/SkfB family radical SAM enzyme
MITENNKNTWCVNPYMNLSVHSVGKIKPCCMSTQYYKTDTGNANLANSSIIEFWNSGDRKKLINDLSNGIKVSGCNSCWKEEDAGKESKRIRDNKSYQEFVTGEDLLPLVVDISIGNLCNLKCRICNPRHSSLWATEESNRLYPNNIKLYFSNEDFSDIKNNFSEDNDYLWKDILPLIKNAVKIDFAGGEPFFIKKQWNLVKDLVDVGSSKNQHIHYNTNGTIFPEEHIEYLNQFKIVDIQVSTDGVGKKFEYMRHPASWESVEENIDKLCKIRDQNSNWVIGVCISVSAFNVYDFFETYEHYAKKNVLIYINTVHDARGIRILPTELKKEIKQKLSNTVSQYNNKQWEKEKNMICNLLDTAPSPAEWKTFCEELNTRDAIRNEKFSDTFPEYFEILKRFI